MRSGTRHEVMDLQTIGRILRQRARVILATVMIFAMLGVLINTFSPSVYQATTRIEIRRTPEMPVASSNFQSENVAMFTAAALITNRGLLGNIVSEFEPRGWIHGGSATDEIAQGVGIWLRRMHLPIPKPQPKPPDPAQRSKQIDWLASTISVEPVRDTRLVDIRVEHTDPEAAVAIADRLTQHFADYQKRRTSSGADSSVRAAVAAAAPSAEHNALSGSGTTTLSRAWMRARLKALDGKVSNTTSEYYRVKSERDQAEARLAQLERYAGDGAVDWSQLPIEGGAIDAMRRDIIGCQTRLIAARQIYRDKHPQVTQIESECASLRASLRREVQRAILTQRADLAVLSSREASLRSTLGQSEMEMGQAEEVHDSQEQQFGGGALAIPTWIPPIEIIDPATVSRNPVRPRKLINLAICVVTGLMVGMGIALLRHSLRHTIRTPEDVEAELDLEVLGVIPKKAAAASW